MSLLNLVVFAAAVFVKDLVEANAAAKADGKAKADYLYGVEKLPKLVFRSQSLPHTCVDMMKCGYVTWSGS